MLTDENAADAFLTSMSTAGIIDISEDTLAETPTDQLEILKRALELSEEDFEESLKKTRAMKMVVCLLLDELRMDPINF